MYTKLWIRFHLHCPHTCPQLKLKALLRHFGLTGIVLGTTAVVYLALCIFLYFLQSNTIYYTFKMRWNKYTAYTVLILSKVHDIFKCMCRYAIKVCRIFKLISRSHETIKIIYEIIQWQLSEPNQFGWKVIYCIQNYIPSLKTWSTLEAHEWSAEIQLSNEICKYSFDVDKQRLIISNFEITMKIIVVVKRKFILEHFKHLNLRTCVAASKICHVLNFISKF